VATPLRIAHRGYRAIAPENSMAAFRRALALGCDLIETDVRRRRDGVLVLDHDDGDRVGAVTLDAFLDLVAGSRAGVNLDIKEPGVAAGIVEAVRRADLLGRTTCTGGEWAELAEVRRRDDRIRIGLTVPPRGAWVAPVVREWELPRRRRRWTASIRDDLERHGADLVTANHRYVDRPFVEAVHGAGAELWCWTVDGARALRRLTLLGVDGICSDRPESHGLSRDTAPAG
jgi:glycerophosphoryl diester phosphodiesterase